jgi:hypothetical protein
VTNSVEWMRRLERGETVRLTVAEQQEVLAIAERVDLPEAEFSGAPILVRVHDRLAALEQAGPDTWALRPLTGYREAKAFLERRRRELDRMWDGCGCRIDYFD